VNIFSSPYEIVRTEMTVNRSAFLFDAGIAVTSYALHSGEKHLPILDQSVYFFDAWVMRMFPVAVS